MDVVKTILKVLLTIIRVPFTIWYVVAGLVLKIITIFEKLMVWAGQARGSSPLGLICAIVTFEWASIVKFYHFHW